MNSPSSDTKQAVSMLAFNCQQIVFHVDVSIFIMVNIQAYVTIYTISRYFDDRLNDLQSQSRIVMSMTIGVL